MMEAVKKNRVQSVFTVKEKIFLTPHYIRVVFSMTDEQAEQFGNVQIGGHNKLFLSDIVTRTYTTRHIEYNKKEIWVDFVAHGDNGPASFWANRTTVGNTLSIAMKDGKRPLFPEADEYLFVGDSTALPVIGAMLEQLPAGVKVNVILEVFGPKDEIPLITKADLNIQWLYNPYPETGSRIADTVRKLKLPVGKRFVFAAAEYDTARALKSYFKEDLRWPNSEYSVVSYWTKGESEDQSSHKRRVERNS